MLMGARLTAELAPSKRPTSESALTKSHRHMEPYTLERIAFGVLLANAAATWFMVGVIWFVQVVHYPLFGGVGTGDFCEYQRRNVGRTTWVVGPPMLIEAFTAVMLLWVRPPTTPSWQTILGAGMLAVAWLSTALLQGPSHGQLSSGFDLRTHRRLVATNWIRTFAWTVRGVLVLVMTSLALFKAF